MSGPSAPNWAGNTRFIGPTGPAGQNGAAGGLTLFLDSATSTSVPTTASLLLDPVLTAQTTSSFAATNSTVLIAKFPSAVGAIGAETIKAMAQAGPEMQAKLLQGLGLQGYLITDGSSPINLFNTAQGMLGGGMGRSVGRPSTGMDSPVPQ